MCVSNRAERPFDLRLDDGLRPRLRMEHLTHQDIANYTYDFLTKVGLDSPDLLQNISNEILWKAEGVFIWVYLVLADVKLGIINFAENWDYIYQRSTTLQPDLMKLYRDMWYRLDGRREVHVARAAKYFSLIRNAVELRDAPAELLQRSRAGYRIRRRSSGRLLGVERTAAVARNDGPRAVVKGETDQQKLAAWDEVRIRFTHKTALEFLDSDEGQALCIKAVLIIQCLHGTGTRDTWRVAGSMWQLTEPRIQLKEGFQPSPLLWLIYGHAKDFLMPLESMSQRNMVLFSAAFHGFLGFVDECLASTEIDRPRLCYLPSPGRAGAHRRLRRRVSSKGQTNDSSAVSRGVANSGRIQVVDDGLSDTRWSLGLPKVFFLEVNDAFLLQLLEGNFPSVADISRLRIGGSTPYVRPLPLRVKDSGNQSYFTCKPCVEGIWTTEDMNQLVCKALGYVSYEDLERVFPGPLADKFDTDLDALMSIGCVLPDAHQCQRCLRYETWSM
ncbi:hypothetical protein CSAL01_11236 [Colletotrichum salicis]|uniref:Uncharacterized protein n=1 Tax=Colletotrichum salicis TaxID=1209931 RepID=A0A135UWQ0_9PEZI|nr:hypothetical protein CSAL01_11236 [Colletotrichum salicis]